ncbi:MAG: 2-oxoglutarate and iron-dependent oxygenase domain-containing protein [Sphingobium sp.]
MTMLPLIDITPLAQSSLDARRKVAGELDSACRDGGFLHVKGAQIDWPLLDRLRARAKAYFALDLARKMESYIGRSDNHSGYVPVGEEQFGTGIGDLKEAYDVNCDYLAAEGRRPLLGPNLWPGDPGFRADVTACHAHMMTIGRQIFRAFALALGLDEQYFDAHLRHPPSQMRLIHYPHDDAVQDRPGIGAHTDYECFTLLFATAPGLQIVDAQGAWVDVPLIDGAMVTNIGDMMEILSNGRYLATRHRVKKLREERYSFPTFFACDYDYVVAPLVRGEAPRYAPLHSGEHLFARTAQTFAYLKRRVAAGLLVSPGDGVQQDFGRREAAGRG